MGCGSPDCAQADGGAGLPAVYRATEEQFARGLRNMSPGLDEGKIREVAAIIATQNAADRLAIETRLATRSPSAMPVPPSGVVSPPMTLARPGEIDTRLLYRVMPSPAGRVWSWLRAVVPWVVGGRASKKLIKARRDQCSAGDQGRSCRYAVQDGAGVFCGACGCPHNWMSDLGTKTTMRDAKCVLGLWPENDRE